MRTQQDWLLNFYSDGMYADDTTGSVDELGYFALTLVGAELWQRTLLLSFDWDESEILDGQFLDPGWYVVETTSQGFINGTRYESESLAYGAWHAIGALYQEFYYVRDDDDDEEDV